MRQPQSRRLIWQSRLADGVAAAIAERVRSGTLAAGEVIGTREALASEYITSESVIDRAVERLVADGVLAEAPDGRFRVAGFPPPAQGFRLPQSSAEVTDMLAILELRMGVELIAAALAAERRSEDQLQAVREAAEGYASAAEAGAGISLADFRFHRAVAAASGNPYIAELIDTLGPLLIPRMRLSLPVAGGGAQDANLQRSIDDHQAIVAALQASDPDAARNAMRLHLARTIELVRSAPAQV